MSEALTFIYCDEIPETLLKDKVYISKKYQIAIHLCLCGCNRESVTPIGGDSGWEISELNNLISFTPSILNRGCESHYYIKNNRVIWT